MKQEFEKRLLDLAKTHKIRHEDSPGENEFSKEVFEQFLRDV